MVVFAVIGFRDDPVLTLLAESDPLEALVAPVADEGARHAVEFVYGVELHFLAARPGGLGSGRAAVLGRFEVGPDEGVFFRESGGEQTAAREREDTSRQNFPRE